MQENESSIEILVVDDEAGMREGCRRALTPSGYTVDVAPDVATARKRLEEAAYEIYLLDVMLPDGSGLDLLAPILDRDPSAICIVITGFGSVEMAVEAVRRGAYSFLAKPFTADELLIRVAEGLEHRRLRLVEQEAEELARAKADLERLDEVKSQLMLKMAHELRAPVAAVQSYINLVVAGYVSDQEVKPTLKRVQERLDEMLDLIADLLKLSHLKQAREQLAKKATPQDVAHILQEVHDMLREQAREKEQTIRLEVSDHPTMLAAPDHLKQIFTNLISNAIKYTPPGGKIEITLRLEGENLIFTIKDTGIGIAPKDRPHLFQEFFRTDEAKGTGEIGTGLGLSIVKQIVDSYGGEIQVSSEPGKGTCFRISLPLQPRPPAAAAPSSPENLPRPGNRRRFPQPGTTHTRALILGQTDPEK